MVQCFRVFYAIGVSQGLKCASQSNQSLNQPLYVCVRSLNPTPVIGQIIVRRQNAWAPLICRGKIKCRTWQVRSIVALRLKFSDARFFEPFLCTALRCVNSSEKNKKRDDFSPNSKFSYSISKEVVDLFSNQMTLFSNPSRKESQLNFQPSEWLILFIFSIIKAFRSTCHDKRGDLTHL